MTRHSLSEFIAIVSTLQEDPSSLDIVQTWVDENQSLLESKFSRGEILRLKRGSAKDVLQTAIRLRPPCQYCKAIPIAKNFDSRGDFEVIMKTIETVLGKGIFHRIPPPVWFESNGGYGGAEGFFKCTVCPAIWHIIIPEREDNGAIDRIA